jgi:hypothetical protein
MAASSPPKSKEPYPILKRLRDPSFGEIMAFMPPQEAEGLAGEIKGVCQLCCIPESTLSEDERKVNELMVRNAVWAI